LTLLLTSIDRRLMPSTCLILPDDAIGADYFALREAAAADAIYGC